MTKVRMLIVGALLAALTACLPTFPEGSSLTATDNGSEVELTWPYADPADDETPVAGYIVKVDGVQVSTVDPWEDGCYLVGLDDNTTYEVEVRAIGSNNAQSDPLAVSHTTGALGSTEESIYCYNPAAG